MDLTDNPIKELSKIKDKDRFQRRSIWIALTVCILLSVGSSISSFFSSNAASSEANSLRIVVNSSTKNSAKTTQEFTGAVRNIKAIVTFDNVLSIVLVDAIDGNKKALQKDLQILSRLIAPPS